MRANASSITITVLDSNDNPPVFSTGLYSATLQEGPVQNRQQVVAVNATDADSGNNGQIVFSIAGGVSGDFQIDPVTVSEDL